MKTRYLRRFAKTIGFTTSLALHLTTFSYLFALELFKPLKIYSPNQEYISAYLEQPIELEFYTQPPVQVNSEPRLQIPLPEIKLEKIVQQEFKRTIRKMDISEAQKQALTNAQLPNKQKEQTLEAAIETAKYFPDNHVREINQKFKQAANLENRSYEPLKQINLIDSNSAVPYYRIVKARFQMLSVDKNGNYIIVEEKPESQMTDADKKNYKLFQMTNQTPGLKEARNAALGFILKILDSQEQQKGK